MKKRYYLKYTCLFAVMAFSVYFYFLLYERSFIFADTGYGDGIMQHYKALCYYAQWLRDIFRNLLVNHKLIIPEWSFSIGYGSDIINTLHYYVIGDPFNLFSALVPIKYMQYYYGAMIILRLYFAGIAFSALGHYWKREKDYHTGILMGALVYVFSLYGISAGIKHPYFINPMIYFPLLILGVEKILNKENPLIFIVTVCISACSNFYFFYMLVILTVCYVLGRLLLKYKLSEIKIIGVEIIRIGLHAILGLALGAVIFLPVIISVLGDSRFGQGAKLDILYPVSYYTRFLSGFLTAKNAGYWTLLGISSVALLAVFVLFAKKREHRGLKLAFFSATAALLIPAAGYLLNGFTYMSNRWVWAYVFLVSCILVVVWPTMISMSERVKQVVFGCLLTYFILCLLLDNSRISNMAFCMVCAFAALCIMSMQFSTEKQNVRVKSTLLLLVLVINVAVNGWFSFSVKSTDYLEKFISEKHVASRIFNNQDQAVAEAAKDDAGFFRYTQDVYNNNSTLMSGLHSTQYYWSLSNPYVVAANQELGILDWTHNDYYDLNSRTALTSLANVRYFADTSGKGIQYAPYGFEYVGTYQVKNVPYQNWDVYRNQYDLPFGYTYESILDKEQFELLNTIEKEEAMLQGAVLDDEDAIMNETEPVLRSQERTFTVQCESDDVTIQGQSFVTTADSAKVTLFFEGLPASETYVVVEGLNYRGCSPLDLYEDDSEFDPLNLYTSEKWNSKNSMQQIEERYKNRNWSEEDDPYIYFTSTDVQGGSAVSESIHYCTPHFTWFAGREDYTVNLGYTDLARNTVTLTFAERGIYSYDSIKIICKPMEGYVDGINKLKEDYLENVIMTGDSITGSIELDSEKILCLTIPYSRGWSAYVDGQEQQLIRTNLMYSGLYLPEGIHQINLVYKTPGLRLGFIISLCSVIVIIGLMVFRRKSHMIKRSR